MAAAKRSKVCAESRRREHLEEIEKRRPCTHRPPAASALHPLALRSIRSRISSGMLRTALLLQLPCGVPADARACLLALGVSHRRAQTALLEGLWSAGGGCASSSLDAALQRWLYAEPAAAAQLVHAAARRPSSCERRLFTRLATNRCTPRRRRASSPSCAVSAPTLSHCTCSGLASPLPSKRRLSREASLIG